MQLIQLMTSLSFIRWIHEYICRCEKQNQKDDDDENENEVEKMRDEEEEEEENRQKRKSDEYFIELDLLMNYKQYSPYAR